MKLAKRDGRLVEFETEKIEKAIIKAMSETELGIDEKLARRVANNIYKKFDIETETEFLVNIEDIQDEVEINLMKSRPDVARRYILYRDERAKLREQGWDMTDLQRDIYNKKYRYNGESFDQFLERVSGGNADIKKAILYKRFMPAGRILAGRGLAQLGHKITLSNCFPAGTKVYTENGYKNIEDIQKGEEVLTHNNRYRKVINTLERDYNGVMYNIKGRLFDVICTNEHPFLTQRGWVNAEDMKTTDYIKAMKKDSEDVNIIYDLKEYTKLREDQEFVENEDKLIIRTRFTGGNGAKGQKDSTPINRYIKMDKDLAYVMGLWLGDGSITTIKENNYIFQIVFNVKEKDIHDRAKKILEDKFGIEFVTTENKDQHTLNLKAYSIPLCEWTEVTFGKYCDGKRIPDELNENLDIVLGLLDSDGLIKTDGGVRLSLKNLKLVESAKNILTLNGYPSNDIKFKGRNGFELWGFDIPNYVTSLLMDKLNKHYNDDRIKNNKSVNTRYATLVDEELYIKISKIEKFDLNRVGSEIKVYNISVDEDESYTVDNMVTHNCYVMPQVEDSIESIFDTAKWLARTYSYGGGVGLTISKLRPKGAKVNNAASTTSGAVSFMDLFSMVTSLIGQNGRRKRYLISK